MARIESWVKCELNKAVQVQYLQGNLFSMDNQGNLVGVEVFDDGEPASLSGTVSANVIRADGATVAVSGTLSGNKCSVILPQTAYHVPGTITIVIKLTASSVVTTLAAVVTTVYRSSTEIAVDPGTIINDINSLIAAIDAAVASIPADYSSLWTSLAPAYSTSNTYAVGQYVTYNGGLYRCTTAITSGESWTSGHWTAAKLGPDISDLKSAFDSILVNEAYTGSWSIGAIASATGANNNSTTRIRTYGYIKVDTGITITPVEGFKYTWFRYAGESTSGYNKNTDYSGEWLTDSVHLPGGWYYRVCAAYTDDRTITSATTASANIAVVIDTISDKSLSLTGKAGDAKVTGDELKKRLSLKGDDSDVIPNNSDIDDYRTIGSYKVTGSSQAETMSNLPETSAGILVVGTLYASTRLVQLYFAYANKEIYYRFGTDSTWDAWRGLSDLDWHNAPEIDANTDANTIREIGVYSIKSSDRASRISNIPVESAGILTVSTTFHNTRFIQIYYAQGTNAVYYRFGTDSAWQDWKVTGQSIAPTPTTDDETVLVFGDSWADEATSSATKWPTYFMRETNVTVKNYAKNGASVYGSDDYSTNGTVGGQVAYAISDGSFTHTDVSTVFMVCGLNDFRNGRSVETVVTAWKTLIDRIHTAFPMSRIICCLNNQIFVNVDQLNYLRGVQNGLRQYGIPAYLIMGWFPTSLYNNDHVHPSETGHAMIASNMIQLFRGGSVNYVQNQYTQSSIGSYITTLAITEMFSNSHITRKVAITKTANESADSEDVSIPNSSELSLNVPFSLPMLNNEDATEHIVTKGTSPETVTTSHRLAGTNELTIVLPVSDAGTYEGYTMC